MPVKEVLVIVHLELCATVPVGVTSPLTGMSNVGSVCIDHVLREVSTRLAAHIFGGPVIDLK